MIHKKSIFPKPDRMSGKLMCQHIRIQFTFKGVLITFKTTNFQSKDTRTMLQNKNNTLNQSTSKS